MPGIHALIESPAEGRSKLLVQPVLVSDPSDEGSTELPWSGIEISLGLGSFTWEVATVVLSSPDARQVGNERCTCA
jgi:hypothetical protein